MNESADIDTFIKQCKRFSAELQNPQRKLRSSRGFGPSTVAEILWAIGKYAAEHNLDLTEERPRS
jgi:hypothetical protein